MGYEAYKMKDLGFTTRQLHAGYNPAEHYRSKAVPIYQTAVFELGDYDRGLRLFEYAEEGHSYVRFSNPTNTVLEKRISALEGGAAAVSFASGMAAISSTLLNLAKAGDEIISVNTLYGGSTTLLAKLFPDYGITPRFAADENDIDAYRRLINDHTRAIYIECLGNPGINILDIEAIAALAHEHGLPLVIDNTFATPYLLRPFEHGADIVCYSATNIWPATASSSAAWWWKRAAFPGPTAAFPNSTASMRKTRRPSARLSCSGRCSPNDCACAS